MLYADLKNDLTRSAATEVYLEEKETSFYTHGIEILLKHWSDCIAFKGYVDEYKLILQNKCYLGLGLIERCVRSTISQTKI